MPVSGALEIFVLSFPEKNTNVGVDGNVLLPAKPPKTLGEQGQPRGMSGSWLTCAGWPGARARGRRMVPAAVLPDGTAPGAAYPAADGRPGRGGT